MSTAQDVGNLDNCTVGVSSVQNGLRLVPNVSNWPFIHGLIESSKPQALLAKKSKGPERSVGIRMDGP
jgi:hypothetical protein